MSTAALTRHEQDIHFGQPADQRDVPVNIEAEQALLGAIMVNNEAIEAIRVPLDPAHFSEPLHREIYQAAVDLRKAKRSANPVTIKQHITDCMIGEMTTSQYLGRLAGEAVSIINVPDYAKAVMDAAARRACITLGSKLDAVAFSKELDISDEVDALRVKFDEVAKALNGRERPKTLADAARIALASTADAYQGRGVIGVDYGIRWLMDMIGPFLAGQLIIVGGATKQGKSSLIEQIIAGAAINGHPVWVNSGEMQAEELAHRALSRLTEIQAWRQIRGKVSDHEYERLEMARRNAETWQERVFIRDDSMSLRQIKREVSEFAKAYPNGLAVQDHIGLVERDQSNARIGDVEFASVVTRSLKQTANDARIPLIAAAQLKKNTFAVEDRNLSRKAFLGAISRRPKYGDIFGSVEKDANHVLIPFRAEPILQELEPAEANDLHPEWEDVMATVKDRAEIILALSRHTRWPQRRDVGWNGPKTMFTDPQQGDQGRML